MSNAIEILKKEFDSELVKTVGMYIKEIKQLNKSINIKYSNHEDWEYTVITINGEIHTLFSYKEVIAFLYGIHTAFKAL